MLIINIINADEKLSLKLNLSFPMTRYLYRSFILQLWTTLKSGRTVRETDRLFILNLVYILEKGQKNMWYNLSLEWPYYTQVQVIYIN